MTQSDNPFVLPWQQAFWSGVWSRVRRDRLPHALLFVGEEGIGKRQFANRLMQALSCEAVNDTGLACGTCHGCRLVLAGTHPDCLAVEPETPGQAIRVDAIRDVTEFASKTRLLARYRVILIDPASAMNINAANALLKVLEEPPAGMVFVLICRSGGVLPATVSSRCQKLLFPQPEVAEARDWLSRQCPGAPVTALLQVTEGAPLKAKEWFENGLFDLQNEFYRDWASVRQRPGMLSEVANKWSTKPLQDKITLRMLLDWLYLWGRDQARAKAIAGEESLSWLDFLQRLQKTSASVTAVPQLNRQLVLEDAMLSLGRNIL